MQNRYTRAPLMMNSKILQKNEGRPHAIATLARLWPLLLGLLLCATPRFAQGLSISATTSNSNFQVGSSMTISLLFSLDPGEELSVFNAHFQIFGLSGLSTLSISYDPSGLFSPSPDSSGFLAGDTLGLAYTRSNSALDGVLAQLSFTVAQNETFSVVLSDVVASKDIPTNPYVADVPTTPFAGTPLLTLGTSNLISLFEDFQTLPVQSDHTGALIQGTTVFVVTNPGGSVASVEGSMAAGTAIEQEQQSGNRYWVLSSSSGDTTASAGFLLIGDLPPIDNGTPSGPYATQFATPLNLIGTQIEAMVRTINGAGSTNVRAVLMDQQGHEVATALVPLTASFAPISFRIHEDFTNLVGSASGFSFTQVVGISLEFQTDFTTAPAYDFHVDDLALSAQPVPEPAANLLTLASLATLAFVSRSRNRI